MRLTDSDLNFVVETVAKRRRDHDHIVELVRDREELCEAMLDDPRLAERLVNDEEVFVRVSPYLMFAVLLRRVRRDRLDRARVRAGERHGSSTVERCGPLAEQ